MSGPKTAKRYQMMIQIRIHQPYWADEEEVENSEKVQKLKKGRYLTSRKKRCAAIPIRKIECMIIMLRIFEKHEIKNKIAKSGD